MSGTKENTSFIMPDDPMYDRAVMRGILTSCGDAPVDVPLYSHILDNLWTGGSAGEFGLPVPDYFVSVLNLYPWVKDRIGPNTTYAEFRLLDSGDVKSQAANIGAAADWVMQRHTAGPILVHCQAGINRSSLIAAVYLVNTGMTPDEAIALIRAKRSPAALCNPAFDAYVRTLGG
jgi:hypothetical protein